MKTTFPSGFLAAFCTQGRSCEPYVNPGDWVVCSTDGGPARVGQEVAVVTRTGLLGVSIDWHKKICGQIFYGDGNVFLKRKVDRNTYESLGPLGPRRLYVPQEELVQELPVYCALRGNLVAGVGFRKG